jgi:hypothetical protein
MSRLYIILLLGTVSVDAFQLRCAAPFLHALQVYPATTHSISRAPMGAVVHTPLHLAMGTVFSDENKPIYLQLDTGVRIARIVTATTTSFDAMLKLGRATSRTEIMKICLIRYRKTCVISEQQTLPIGHDEVQHPGWRYGHRPGSNVLTNSGTSSSSLWVVDMDPQSVQVSVGSWLLASMTGGTNSNRLSALFTHTSSRALPDPRSISLIRPGFSPPRLVKTDTGLQWVVVLIEMQNCTELGTAK